MDTYHETREQLLDAALMHVPFDGWSEATFRAAARDAGIDPALARAVLPRGAVDLALAFHRRGDDQMARRMRDADTRERFRDRVAQAVRFRLEAAEDKEAVRRGTTLFALPMHAADGAKALWGTADRIWTELGDTSEDYNWYTKRGTLAGVYGSTVLYWLGDTSDGDQATWDFLDRRIDDVMQIEKVKGHVRSNPVLKTLLAGPSWLLGQIRAPSHTSFSDDFPGKWSAPLRR